MARGHATAVISMLLAACAITTLAFVLGWRGVQSFDAADGVRVEQLRGSVPGGPPAFDSRAEAHLAQGRDALIGSGALAALLVVAGLAFAVRSMRRIEALELRVGLLSRMDGQTGMPNRRAWDERLAHELAQSRRLGYPVTVAMIDPDHFRDYNARVGREAGDRLLADIAVTWTASLRKGDLFARYSGERFALLLPGCAAPQAGQLVERLRSAVPDGQTVSAGVACWHWRESIEELVARAHDALEAAKTNGRNRIEVSPSPDPNVDRPAHRRMAPSAGLVDPEVETA